MTLFYAGIGPRETPEDICKIMTNIAEQLSDSGWVLRSGHAKGADQAYGVAANEAEILLPWDTFNGARADGFRYFVPEPRPYVDEAIGACDHWANCNSTSQLLLLRNVPIVLGYHCLQPVQMVVTWLPNGTKHKIGNGTKHACRVAQKANIPIFNINFEKDQRMLVNFVAEQEGMI